VTQHPNQSGKSLYTNIDLAQSILRYDPAKAIYLKKAQQATTSQIRSHIEYLIHCQN